MNNNEKLVLIDGHSILNRAFYGVPELTNSSGIHTNAVYGFLNIMFKIIDEEKPSHLIVAFDVKQPTFRHKMYSAYKGTRKPMPQELHEQVPLIKEVLQAMNISIAELPGYEADDILGTLSKTGEKTGMKVSIITGDRDLLQLASDNILIRIPKTKKGNTEVEDYHTKDVVEKYSVTPLEFIDVKALMGDTADNIPGVPSVGAKTATALISEYKSIENIYENIDKITKKKLKENLETYKDQAFLSKTLATIDINAPVNIDIIGAVLGDIYTKDALDIVKKLEFKSMVTRFSLINDNKELDINYKLVNDFTESEELFNKAFGMKSVAVALFNDDSVKMQGNCNNKKDIILMAMTFNDECTYLIVKEGFITDEYLIDKFELILKDDNILTSLIDLKWHLKFIKDDKFDSESVFDSEMASYLMNPLKDTYNYDDIARDYLQVSVPSRQELLGKMTNIEAFEKNKNSFEKYAALTTMVVYRSVPVLTNSLNETKQYNLFKNIEIPLIFALNRMEDVGVKVEKNELKKYGEKLSKRIETLEKDIYSEVGTEFNINSPKQLGEILFVKMGIPSGKKTKTGYSTSADVLEKLADEYPVVSKILNYRQLTKLKSTYADGLANYICDDERIHGVFNQTITATGRISSTEPNLQNIPIRMEIGKELRKIFVPEKGYKFIDADYSQIELRVLAHISGDDNLIEAYKSAQDIHRITASKVFNTPFEEVTDIQRRNAKAVNFGIVYGISSFGLSQDLSISRKQASEYIKQYFVTYPKIKEFLDNVVEQAKENGYVTTMFGRRRPIPELKSSNFMQRSFGERVAMNSPIQGTAADIIKIAMINVDRRLRTENLKSRIVLQVHDELLIEAADDEIDVVSKIMEECMQNAAELSVQLEIGIGIGDNWLEAH